MSLLARDWRTPTGDGGSVPDAQGLIALADRVEGYARRAAGTAHALASMPDADPNPRRLEADDLTEAVRVIRDYAARHSSRTR